MTKKQSGGGGKEREGREARRTELICFASSSTMALLVAAAPVDAGSWCWETAATSALTGVKAVPGWSIGEGGRRERTEEGKGERQRQR